MHWDSFFGTWGLVMSYGLSTLPLSYLYSMAFDGPSAAQISITGINFLTGFGFVIVYGVLVRRLQGVEFVLGKSFNTASIAIYAILSSV